MVRSYFKFDFISVQLTIDRFIIDRFGDAGGRLKILISIFAGIELKYYVRFFCSQIEQLFGGTISIMSFHIHIDEPLVRKHGF